MDILKGIGVLSVILGHSVAVLPLLHVRIGEFVYLYHIMVFFFPVGFLYDQKYADNPGAYIGKRFYGIFIRFVVYNALFVVLHNALAAAALIVSEPYSLDQIIIWLAAGCVLQTNETLLGAFWFLPVLFVACVLFGTSVTLSYKASKRGRPALFMAAFALLFAAVGLYMNSRGMFLSYHIQTAFLAVPILYLGWVVKRYFEAIRRCLSLPGCIASGALLYLCVHFHVIGIELSRNQIGNVFLFYPVSVLGIYFCLCLSEFVKRALPITRRALVYIGKHSFHYMALHFLVFKLLDRAVSLFNGDPEATFSVFPHAYDLGLLYPISAVAVISAVLWLTGSVKKSRSACEARSISVA